MHRNHCVCTRVVSHKTCSRCGQRKGAAEFNNNKVSPDGLCSYCKPCNAAAAAERRKRRVPVPAPTVVDKACSHCKEVRTPTQVVQLNRDSRSGVLQRHDTAKC